MIRIFISLVFCLMSAFACAQSSQSDDMYQWGKNKANEQLVNDLKSRQKALWKDQRDLQNRIDSVYWDEALDAIKDTTFTFEADKVVFPYGQIAYVNSNTNFVSVNKMMLLCRLPSMFPSPDLMALVELRFRET